MVWIETGSCGLVFLEFRGKTPWSLHYHKDQSNSFKHSVSITHTRQYNSTQLKTTPPHLRTGVIGILHRGYYSDELWAGPRSAEGRETRWRGLQAIQD